MPLRWMVTPRARNAAPAPVAQAARALGRIAVGLMIPQDWAHAQAPAPGHAQSGVGRALLARGSARPGARSGVGFRDARLAGDGYLARGDFPARQSRCARR